VPRCVPNSGTLQRIPAHDDPGNPSQLTQRVSERGGVSIRSRWEAPVGCGLSATGPCHVPTPTTHCTFSLWSLPMNSTLVWLGSCLIAARCAPAGDCGLNTEVPIGESHLDPKKSAQAAPGFTRQPLGVQLGPSAPTIWIRCQHQLAAVLGELSGRGL
jgi:hypothetical protein